MLVDVVMPKMGESITEGTILEWRKKVGDPVEKDELFLEKYCCLHKMLLLCLFFLLYQLSLCLLLPFRVHRIV